MKAWVWLMAMYVLLLSGVPCPDRHCHHDSAPTTAHSRETDGDCDSPCSPFCHCASCAGFTAPQLARYESLSSLPVIHRQPIFSYQTVGYSDIALSIWQPPKV